MVSKDEFLARVAREEQERAIRPEPVTMPELSEHWHNQRAAWMDAAIATVANLPNGALWVQWIAAKSPWGVDADDAAPVDLPPEALDEHLSPRWVQGWDVIETLKSAGLLRVTDDWRIEPTRPER